MSDGHGWVADVARLQLRQATDPMSPANRPAVTKGEGEGQKDGLRQACQQFEALLLNFMLREMRATVPESALFPTSMAEELFSGLRDERIAGEMAEHGGIGLSRIIFDQLAGGK